jgi:hypothetical protein
MARTGFPSARRDRANLEPTLPVDPQITYGDFIIYLLFGGSPILSLDSSKGLSFPFA